MAYILKKTINIQIEYGCLGYTDFIGQASLIAKCVKKERSFIFECAVLLLCVTMLPFDWRLYGHPE